MTSRTDLALAQKGRDWYGRLAQCGRPGAGDFYGPQQYRCATCGIDFGYDWFGFCLHLGKFHVDAPPPGSFVNGAGI